MKCFAVVLLFALVGSSWSEAPRFRSSRLRSGFSARQEVEPTTPAVVEDAPYPPAGGPYPPSGWKPTGQAFELPTEAKTDEVTTPDNAYGAPVDVYGPPSNEYGPPTTPTDADATTDVEVGPEAEITEPPTVTGKSGRFRALPKSQRLVQRQPEQSGFYILLPDNTLQRIDVRPTGARVNNRFNAKILQEVPLARNSRF